MSNYNDSQPDAPEDGGLPSEMFDNGEPSFVTEGTKPARSAAMMAVLIAVLGAGGLYFMKMKSGPSTAAASTESAKANTAINEFLADGGRNMKQMRSMLQDTEKFVNQFLNYASMPQVKVEDLKTNPFALRQKEQGPTPAELAAQAAKKAAEDKEREKMEIAKAAGALRLQSILRGAAVRTCMIGNVAYGEGQEVEGFVIDRIEQDRVVVSRGGYRFEVRMPSRPTLKK
jgi:hypothetical protein